MSNQMNKRTMEFDVGDAPMLMAAFRLAACTAMMCGHKDAEKRLRQYQKFMQDNSRAVAALFDEEVWAEIVMALADAKKFAITVAPPPWRSENYWREGYIQVVVGGQRVWRTSRSNFKPDAPEIMQIYDALLAVAPIGCVREEVTE